MSRQARAVKLSQRLNTRLRASAAAVSSGIVTSGLVMHLDAGDTASYPGSGTAWTDLSGSGNNGTFTATPTVSSGNVAFDGSYHVDTTNSFTNPQNFTIGFWFKTNNPSGRRIIGFDTVKTGLSAAYDRQFFVDTAGNLKFFVWAPGFDIYNYGPVIDNVWRYVAVAVSTGGVQNHTINGVTVANRTVTLAAPNTGWWRIAGLSNSALAGGTDGGFIGDIGPVHVYNRALSAAEITQNFDAQRARFGL